MTDRLLVLGNKKYSSWSLRAWIGLEMAGVPFRELVVPLFRPETAAEIARFSPAGKVPILVDATPMGPVTVHDSLAILEYVNETYGEWRLWPSDPRQRAAARCISAEMHAGFPNLRSRLPMNLARSPAPPAPEWAVDVATQAEIDRILSLWDEALAVSGGPFLFGEWSIADCMYLPVVTRLHTYAIPVAQRPRCMEYMERMLALPAFGRWQAAGAAESEVHPDYDR